MICELEVGVRQTVKQEANHRTLNRIFEEVRIWPLERANAEEYAKLFAELRRKGFILSQVDMMLAAMARVRDATILTADNDFQRVDGLRVENWL